MTFVTEIPMLPDHPDHPRSRWFSWSGLGLLALGVLVGAGGHALWGHRGVAIATVNAALMSDVENLAFLARTQASKGQLEESLPTFRRALSLRPNDPALMVDFAEALAFANGQKLEGEAADLVTRVLRIDPNNIKALTLSSDAALAKGDGPTASQLMQRALSAVPANQPEVERQLQGRLNLLEQRIDQSVRVTGSAGKDISGSKTLEQSQRAYVGPRSDLSLIAPAIPASMSPSAPSASFLLAGTVTLAQEVLANVLPTDSVMISVEQEGKDAPLSSVRKQVKDLPWRFTFSTDLLKAVRESGSTPRKIVVRARITREKDAGQRSIDWIGESAPATPGSAGIRVEIVKPDR